MPDEKYLSSIEKFRHSNRTNKCLCKNCNEKAIFSHVFQKNGILSEIAENGKVMAFTYKDLFSINRNELPIGYVESGINRTFGFYGFCSHHDDSLFRPIEKTKLDIDWYDEENQFLLGYKALCRELDTQYIIKDLFTKSITSHQLSEDSFLCFLQEIGNRDYSIDVLEKYIEIFEESLSEKKFEKYSFRTTQLPFRLDLCLSSPITIREECKGPYFGTDKDRISDTVNIVNIFPYKKSTVIIIGFLNSSENIWANIIYEKLRGDYYEDYCIALQDILFRSEFHCMSKSLYTKIQGNIPRFLKEWLELRESFEYDLNYKSNIFKEYVGNQLGFCED